MQRFFSWLRGSSAMLQSSTRRVGVTMFSVCIRPTSHINITLCNLTHIFQLRKASVNVPLMCSTSQWQLVVLQPQYTDFCRIGRGLTLNSSLIWLELVCGSSRFIS